MFLLNMKQFSSIQCFIKGIRRNEFVSGPSMYFKIQTAQGTNENASFIMDQFAG